MRQKEKGQGLEQDLKPEQKAREEIDKLLSAAGFELRDFKDCTLGDSTPNAARNFAIREFDNFNLTNMNLSLVTSPLSAEHLREFESCFCVGAMENRKESERFRSFGIGEIKQRDKMNLDIFWIKDESLEDLENLPSPKDLSEEICISLKNALKEIEQLKLS